MTENERPSLDTLAAKARWTMPNRRTPTPRPVRSSMRPSHVFARRASCLSGIFWPPHSSTRSARRRSRKSRRAADKAVLSIGELRGRRMVTTREVLAEEQRITDFAREGRGTCDPFVRQFDEFRDEG